MTGLIILAAGASTRLDRPKQLLKFKDETLISRSINAGINAGCDPIIVVLGAHSDQIKSEISNKKVQAILNPHWEEGIGSSIRTGISAMQKHEAPVDNTIIMLCDQPMVDATLLCRLITKEKKTEKGMVACAYNDTIGVPVLYQQDYFSELLRLSGDEGAKKLLYQHREEVATIPFPGGAIDIDTNSDVRSYL
ncbi:MAG TPA: nucleotidyltransferase family protein [Balneolales bacterium]|nr:nucleotidyltransferase family protein [Balneolales bacterium]